MAMVGSSFAPPLSDDLLLAYQGLILDLPDSALRDGLVVLYSCCDLWWEQPESALPGEPHPLGIGQVVPLENEHVEELKSYLPDATELTAIQLLCDQIPVDNVTLRDAAFHLLWHVRELELGREPLTTDKIKVQ